MKRKLLIYLLSTFFLFTANSQRFQVTTGAALAEEYWAVTEEPALPSGVAGYVTIGNVTSTGGIGQIWISSYSSTGVLLSSSRVTTNRKLIARDMSKAPNDPTNGQLTYYVTGWSQSVAPTGGIPLNQAFICRIRLNGTVMWYREDPTTPNGLEKEGVAVVTASNGDVAVVGNVKVTGTNPDLPPGSKIFLARFSPTGGMLWHNVYHSLGNWKVREMTLGMPTTTSCAGTPSMPSEFAITGEVQFPTSTSAGRPTTFVGLYSGIGMECWRNLFPASFNTTTTGDAGYDLIYNPARNSYFVAGVVQTGPGRSVPTSTPYFVEVSPFGGFMGAAAYLNPSGAPLGLYPRCIALAHTTPGTVGSSVVFAGPDFAKGKVFMGSIPTVGGPALFTNYDGMGTANSFGQPFILDDVQPEGILTTRLNNFPGYLISTNSYPTGAFGRGDGHLIKTNITGQTPDSCKNNPIQSSPAFSQTFQSFPSNNIAEPQWSSVQPSTFTYAVQQKFCRDICVVNSNFTFTQSGATASFTGLGSGNGSLSYNWTFGDGGTSTSQNPTHTYAASGTYTVCLTVTNVNGSGDTCRAVFCKDIIVNVVNCDVKASFTYSISCKYKVTHTNTSSGSGTLTYTWMFDDGTTSTLKNPIKTYTTCGRHVTKLITCNAVCCDTVEIVVIIPCCEVKSDFCLQDSGLYVKLIYNTAMNLPTTTYSVYVNGTLTTWNNNTSKLLSAGINTVCLKARRVSCPGDTCCATCCKTIRVRPICTLQSDFWYTVQSNGTVAFANKTTPTGYTSSWDFGDGSPLSTATNPTKTYSTPGTYLVCLTTRTILNNDTCWSTVCKNVIIEPACKVVAKFKTKYCISTPLQVDFINFSAGATSYMWTFGDGNSSSAMSPTHVYAAPGTYIVCLWAKASSNCYSKVCYRLVVSDASCNTSCTTLPPINDRSLTEEIESDIVTGDAVLQEQGKQQDNGMQSRRAETKTDSEDDKLNLFPNPASQKIQIVYSAVKSNNAEITVLNALGNIVYKRNIAVTTGKNQFSIPLQTFADGNYFVKLNAGNGVKTSMFSVKN